MNYREFKEKKKREFKEKKQGKKTWALSPKKETPQIKLNTKK